MTNQEIKDYIMCRIKENDAINDRILEYLYSEKKKYIVGTTRQASVCLEIFRNFCISIDGLIIPSTAISRGERKGVWKSLIDIKPKYLLPQIDKNEGSVFLLAVEHSEYRAETHFMMQYGICKKNIYGCDWTGNQEMRNISYGLYKQMEFKIENEL